VSPPRRWPMHPRPGPLESLSSWLERLARLYNLSVKDLLTHNLGLFDLTVPADLDHDPPAMMLTALAERTGVEPAQLKAMTLAGWVPWLSTPCGCASTMRRPPSTSTAGATLCCSRPAKPAPTSYPAGGPGADHGFPFVG